jgi:hypothetical protein
MGCLMKTEILKNVLLHESYIIEIDGKFESEYGTLMGALKAGLELRQKFPHVQVKVHDANEPAPADERLNKKTEPA